MRARARAIASERARTSARASTSASESGRTSVSARASTFMNMTMNMNLNISTTYFTFFFYKCLRLDAGRPRKLVDVVFVMGSRQPNAVDQFSLEQRIAMSMIDKPKTADTMYAVVQYGKTAVTRVHFKHSRTDEDTKEAIKSLRWYQEGTGLDDGIKMAGEVHELEGRVNVRKIVVVFSSGPIEPSEKKLINVLEPLKRNGVKIIPVVVDDTDDSKLEVITKKKPFRPQEIDRIEEETFKGK